MEEIWKPIKDYEGIYEVSNLGRIRTLDREIHYKNGKIIHKKGMLIAGRVKTGNSKSAGYIIYDLHKDNKVKTVRCHRIVAEAFIPNPDNLSQVNHIDGDKKNNCVSNLEWCDQSHNMKHSYSNNLRKVAVSGLNEHNQKVSKKVALCDKDFNILKEFNSIKELASHINEKRDSISQSLRVNNGKTLFKKKFYIKYL